MSTNLENEIRENVQALTEEQQQQVLDFVRELRGTTSLRKTIWERLQPYLDHIPQEELDELPTDASSNLDHYLYGAPKK